MGVTGALLPLRGGCGGLGVTGEPTRRGDAGGVRVSGTLLQLLLLLLLRGGGLSVTRRGDVGGVRVSGTLL